MIFKFFSFPENSVLNEENRRMVGAPTIPDNLVGQARRFMTAATASDWHTNVPTSSYIHVHEVLS